MLRVSIDVGGTFTDFVAFDDETCKFVNIKVPSVPRNLELGVTDALRVFLADHDPSLVQILGHATTFATIALLRQIDPKAPQNWPKRYERVPRYPRAQIQMYHTNT